jgi:ketosteroid isomerase-like protein
MARWVEECMQEELERLKATYAAWNERGVNALPLWRELMAEDFQIASIDSRADPSLAFVARKGARDEALAYLWGIFDEWDMVHYTPRHYVTQGDRIAMFGVCAFRNKKTKKVAEFAIACLWRFSRGRAVELFEVFDSAVPARAAVP